MRDGYPIERATTIGDSYDAERVELWDSPDQAALVWINAGEAVAASPVTGGTARDIQIDLVRYRSDSDLISALDEHRTRDLGLPAFSQNTHFITSVADYSERTRILALDGERLALDDHDLLDWLINAEKQMLLGTDHHPVFETSLESTACSLRRLPNGQISMTEVPRLYVDSLAARMRTLAGGRIDLTIETPLRAIARYFLTATDKGSAARRPGKDAEVTAFLMINRSGYSFGLWSPRCGFFSEDAFLAPDEITRRRRGARREPAKEIKDAHPGEDRESVEAYVRQAFDQLSLQMTTEKLKSLQLTTYAQVGWVCESGLDDIARRLSTEWENKTGVDYIALEKPVDEAVASGLLLGSYASGGDAVAGSEILPSIDLARDILALADSEESERRREDEARLEIRRDRAAMAVFAAPLIVAGFLMALVAGGIVSYMITSIRDSRADARTLELRPAVERRRTYESSLKWYQEFIGQVSQLRRQQPVGLGMLRELNKSFPFTIDPSFYVSDLKLTEKGEVEIKGMARSKDAVASFIKSLEFAGGAESGTRLFSNLAYEVQEVAPVLTAAGQVKAPSIAGSTLTNNIAAAPGVVVWSIKGNYLPMAEFGPKPKPATQPAAPGQTAPGQVPDPAAALQRPPT
ncbi:MAG: hypothetical protein IPG67_10130 [Acidobacteria bacterium]|nr:hypothetical protein [Acidobacteriota bacterium]